MKRLVFTILVFVVAGWPADAFGATTRGTPRILYSSDWLGPTQIFAVDAARRKPLAQLTSGRPEQCSAWLHAITCGFLDPIPSPDGRRIAYRSTGSRYTLWIANADGRNARLVGTNLQGDPGLTYAVWSPDSRRLAYFAEGGYRLVRSDGSSAGGDAALLFRRWARTLRDKEGNFETVISPDGRFVAVADARSIAVTNRRTKQTRVLAAEGGFSLAWSPDSKSLAYVSGFLFPSGTLRTGDLRVVTLAGKVRTVVRRDSRYGGQIVSAAWARPPATVRYRRPSVVDGVYAGGEVARLAADGSLVAFSACNSVYAWTPSGEAPSLIDGNPSGGGVCFPPSDRVQVYDLAVAGDRVVFGRTGGGLTPRMTLLLRTHASPLERHVLAEGGTSVGGHLRGVGTLAGSGALLVYSSWDGRPAGTLNADVIVTTQTIRRVVSLDCPCPAIASWPGLGVTLDVDGGRIVVNHAFWGDDTWGSRRASLAILDAAGMEILSLPIDAAAAQLSGRDLVVVTRGRLLHYDATGGAVLHSWSLPDAPSARDCRFWSGPDCPGSTGPPSLVLQDVARGLAAYTFEGKVHVVRLADGRHAVVGHAQAARFMDTGLVYADGARIRLVPWSSLS